MLKSLLTCLEVANQDLKIKEHSNTVLNVFYQK